MKPLTVNGIEFDDYEQNDDDTWSQLCVTCADNFPGHDLDDNATKIICGVKGCQSEADYYIDF